MSTQHKNLREALSAAMAQFGGTVFKEGANKAQGYRYVGHEHVVEHVRKALVANGVVIVPTNLRFISEMPKWTTRSGEQTAWLWEQTFEICHAGSDECRTVTVQATTNANDKAAFVASTAADRTLLMRLMRLAGTSEENPEHDSHDDERGGGPAKAATKSEPGVAKAVMETLHRELAAQPDFDALALFHNHALTQMDKARVDEGPRQAFWAAWGKRCEALRLNPGKVAAAARAKAAA